MEVAADLKRPGTYHFPRENPGPIPAAAGKSETTNHENHKTLLSYCCPIAPAALILLVGTEHSGEIPPPPLSATQPMQPMSPHEVFGTVAEMIAVMSVAIGLFLRPPWFPIGWRTFSRFLLSCCTVPALLNLLVLWDDSHSWGAAWAWMLNRAPAESLTGERLTVFVISISVIVGTTYLVLLAGSLPFTIRRLYREFREWRRSSIPPPQANQKQQSW